MSLEWLRTSMEVKQVNTLQRIISGYAAVIGNVDLGDDVIDSGAFTKTLSKKAPADIGVFIGHDTSSLPVGIPIMLRVDGKGLYSETLVKPGPVGDDLLATAQFMAAHGRPLGQSIGYRVPPGGAKLDRVSGKTVRRLMEIDLHEYSFAAGMAVMNPEALTTGVKGLSEGADTAGGFTVEEGKAMDYTVELRGDKYHVLDGDGKSVGSYDTEAAAKAAMAMHKERAGGKTVTNPNDLPDSAFLFIEAGGQKDEAGRTVPRHKRHFAYRDGDGKVDAQALKTALTAIPEAKTIGLSANDLLGLKTQARRMADAVERGADPEADVDQWKTGAPADLLAVAYGLIDLAGRIVTQHKALAVIGDDTQRGWKLRVDGLDEMKALAAQLGRAVEQADLVAQGKDEEAQADWWRAQFDLMEVAS